MTILGQPTGPCKTPPCTRVTSPVGPDSRVFFFPPSAPGPPVRLVFPEVRLTSVRIVWQPPEEPNGIILGKGAAGTTAQREMTIRLISSIFIRCLKG